MPELPEVETVRLGLAPVMEGRRIVSVKLNRGDLRFPFPDDFAARISGQRVLKLDRRAKYLLFSLEGGETLIGHLGMSGTFRIEGDEVSAPGDFHFPRSQTLAHDHVVFQLEQARIVYNDPRRFGFMTLHRTDRLDENAYLAKLGLEPLGPSFTSEALAKAMHGVTTTLKAALLDQSRIAGLGNIYVSEALHRAKLSPMAPAGVLASAAGKPVAATRALVKAIGGVLSDALEAGGSTLRNHRTPDGELGYFQHRFAVYDREGQSCLRPGCKGVIARVTQNGRSTFFCATCQR